MDDFALGDAQVNEARLLQCLRRIVAEIENDLLQLFRFTRYGRSLNALVDRELDVRWQGCREKSRRLRNQHLDAYAFLPAPATPAEGQYLPHQLAGPLAGPADLRKARRRPTSRLDPTVG